jgi:hypothetical protein
MYNQFHPEIFGVKIVVPYIQANSLTTFVFCVHQCRERVTRRIFKGPVADATDAPQP